MRGGRGPRPAQRVRRAHHRCGARTAGRDPRTPALATGDVEIGDCEVEVLSAAEPIPFPIDDRRRRGRDPPAPPPLHRPARGRGCSATCWGARRSTPRSAGPWSARASSRSRRRCSSPRPRRARATSSCPRRLTPWRLLRPAAVSAALQAARDGRRPGPLLPDRPLPPGRGPARRSAVRVHAARPRGQLRRPGRGAGVRLRCDLGGHRCRDGLRARCDRADHLARGAGALRLGQARPALRHGAGRADRGVRRHGLQRLQGALHQGDPGARRR